MSDDQFKRLMCVIAFCVCMYFGFTYGSGWAFFGAFLAFLEAIG